MSIHAPPRDRVLDIRVGDVAMRIDQVTGKSDGLQCKSPLQDLAEGQVVENIIYPLSPVCRKRASCAITSFRVRNVPTFYPYPHNQRRVDKIRLVEIRLSVFGKEQRISRQLPNKLIRLRGGPKWIARDSKVTSPPPLLRGRNWLFNYTSRTMTTYV